MSADRSIEPEKWLELHGDALWAFAMLRLGDREAAEEAIQETFAAALRTREGYSGRSTERTWLIAILKHKILDHLRRESRRSRVRSEPEAEAGASFDGRGVWAEAPGRWAEDATRAAERGEFWDAFRLCLGELPPTYAEAFTLVELDGLAPQKICELLGITPTNLNSRLHRARILLRRGMELRWFGRDRGR